MILDIVRDVRLRISKAAVGFETLPQLRNLSAAKSRQGKRNESPWDQVDHSRLSPVEGAHDDLANGETDAVPSHGYRKIVGAKVEAFRVVEAHCKAQQKTWKHNISKTNEGKLGVLALCKYERYLPGKSWDYFQRTKNRKGR
jgi:hypothetical protein